MELIVLEKEIGKLTINFEDLKLQLQDYLEEYEDFEVTEENFTKAKSTRSHLNNVESAINNRKKELKREIMQPYQVFENQAKELMGMIKEVNVKIDEGIKKIELKEREEKVEKVIELWRSKNYSRVLLTQISDEKWLNKGTTLKSISKDMDEKIKEIKTNLDAIKTMTTDKSIQIALQSKYISTLDFGKTLQDFQMEQEAKKRLFEEQEQEQENENGNPQIIEQNKEKAENSSKTLVMTLTVRGTREQFVKLGNFLKDENIVHKVLGGKND